MIMVYWSKENKDKNL